jgi:hypothetical protein
VGIERKEERKELGKKREGKGKEKEGWELGRG